MGKKVLVDTGMPAMISSFKKLRSKICEHCPLCVHARKNPDSMIGKMLHSKVHADNCPLWKAYRDLHSE